MFVVLGAVVLGALAADRARQRLVLPRDARAGAWSGPSARSRPGRCTSAGRSHGRGSRARGRCWCRVVYGALLAGVFVVGGAGRARDAVRSTHQVHHVLDHADQGSVPLLAVITAVNGVAEELFFRGALYAATTALPGGR